MILSKELWHRVSRSLPKRMGHSLPQSVAVCSSFATAGPVVFEALRRVYRPDTDEASWVPARCEAVRLVPKLLPERLLQQRLHLTFRRHRIQNIGVPIKSSVDEHLRQCRPIRHLGERFPLGRLRENIDDFIGISIPVEKLHRLSSEPAHRHLLGPLAVHQNLMCFYFLLNLFLNRFSHGRPP